jgi:hypothetical protein
MCCAAGVLQTGSVAQESGKGDHRRRRIITLPKSALVVTTNHTRAEWHVGLVGIVPVGFSSSWPRFAYFWLGLVWVRLVHVVVPFGWV